jgi:hypothetical protein
MSSLSPRVNYHASAGAGRVLYVHLAVKGLTAVCRQSPPGERRGTIEEGGGQAGGRRQRRRARLHRRGWLHRGSWLHGRAARGRARPCGVGAGAQGPEGGVDFSVTCVRGAKCDRSAVQRWGRGVGGRRGGGGRRGARPRLRRGRGVGHGAGRCGSERGNGVRRRRGAPCSPGRAEGLGGMQRAAGRAGGTAAAAPRRRRREGLRVACGGGRGSSWGRRPCEGPAPSRAGHQPAGALGLAIKQGVGREKRPGSAAGGRESKGV